MRPKSHGPQLVPDWTGNGGTYGFQGTGLGRMRGMSLTPVPAPFAYEGLLYINGGRGRALLALRPGATGDITLKEGETSNEHIVWSQPRGGTDPPSSVAYL